MIFNIDTKKFVILCIVMLIIWASIWTLFYLKADEITKDPCSICANRMSDRIICTTGGLQPIQRIYYDNFTIKQVQDDMNTVPLIPLN